MVSVFSDWKDKLGGKGWSQMKNFKYSQATFVNCELSVNHLLVFTASIDCLYARAYLKENGIESVQFVCDNPPNVYDLADDILSLTESLVVFHVSEQNYYLSRAVTHELKKIDPSKTIVYIGAILAENAEYILQHTQADLCVLSHPGKIIYELLMRDREEFQNLGGIALKVGEDIFINRDITSFNYEPSPYFSKQVAINYAHKLGILVTRHSSDSDDYNISLGCLKTSLELILDALPDKNVCIPLDSEDISEYTHFSDLPEILSSFPFTYKSKIKVQSVEGEMIFKLSQLNFTEISVVVDDGKYWFNDTKWVDILDEYARQNIKFTYVFQGTSIDSPKIFPKRYIPLTGIEHLSMTKTDKYPSTLINGFMSFMTGVYPRSVLNNSVKHVELSNSRISFEEMCALKEFISVNSAIIVPLHEDEMPRKDIVSFYTEGDSVLRSLNEVYDENIAGAYSHDFYIPHLYLQRWNASQSMELIFDDLNTHSPLQCACVPYSKVDDKSPKEINLLSIEKKEDLEKFLCDVDFFISNAMFKNQYEITHNIKDACRWFSSECTVRKLPRLRLENCSLISPCGGCSRSIGSVHDSYFKVYQEVHVMSDEEQVNRDCSACKTNNCCSKCCFLPDFLDASQFCEVMKTRPYINLYMGTRSTLSVLMEKSILRSSKLADIKVSNKYVSHLISNQLIETSSEYLHPYIYLFHENENHYIINAATGKVFGASEVMAVILEFLQKCVDMQTAKALFSNKYSLDEYSTNKVFNKNIGLFVQSGLMRRMVV